LRETFEKKLLEVFFVPIKVEPIAFQVGGKSPPLSIRLYGAEDDSLIIPASGLIPSTSPTYVTESVPPPPRPLHRRPLNLVLRPCSRPFQLPASTNGFGCNRCCKHLGSSFRLLENLLRIVTRVLCFLIDRRPICDPLGLQKSVPRVLPSPAPPRRAKWSF